MAESHTAGALEGEFCSQRKDKCDCKNGKGNKYKDACKPSVDWGKYPQKYTKKQKKGQKVIALLFKAVRRAHEAHHIACVASVTKAVTKSTDIENVVRNTPWCVNKKENVIALPMWSHTISWYCHFSQIAADSPEALESCIKGSISLTNFASDTAPPFANLPQHDYDHAAYITEVDKALEEIVERIKAVKGHEKQAEKLKSSLDNLVEDYREILEDRGLRTGGTHAAWNKGMNERSSDWYLPFSMASNQKAEKRDFPLKDLSCNSTLANKIHEVAMAFSLEKSPIKVFL